MASANTTTPASDAGSTRLGLSLIRAALLGAAVLITAGCGREGPPRFEISGTVNYDGKPVPGGRILFAPDTDQQNTGPGSVAEIVDGRFRTRTKKGYSGGPCVVTIYGTDGTVATEEHDNALFEPYETRIDLPEEHCEFEFDVPVRSDTAGSSGD